MGSPTHKNAACPSRLHDTASCRQLKGLICIRCRVGHHCSLVDGSIVLLICLLTMASRASSRLNSLLYVQVRVASCQARRCVPLHCQPATQCAPHLPPPYHDIYFVEDLAQLIFDLHQVGLLSIASMLPGRCRLRPYALPMLLCPQLEALSRGKSEAGLCAHCCLWAAHLQLVCMLFGFKGFKACSCPS